MIQTISYKDILEVWKEPDMWMKNHVGHNPPPYSPKTYSGDRFSTQPDPVFYAYFIDGEIAGVNSYYEVSQDECRSRGLYVYPEFRNEGIAIKLLKFAINQNIDKKYRFIWSMPRDSARRSYEQAGFKITTGPFDMGVYINYKCRYDYET